MQFLVTDRPDSQRLSRAQGLMQIAMRRLEKEFYQILSMNRAHLDPESVSTLSSRTSSRSSLWEYDDNGDDDIRVANDSITKVEDASTIAMEVLRSIAESMTSSGYTNECLKIYKIIRKSIVDEAIYLLGVETFTSSHIRKLDPQALDLRIHNWLDGFKTAVQILFNGERVLCDYVFACSDYIRESCFAEITKRGATTLFAFPQSVAKNSKKSSDKKVFRALDMYAAITSHWRDIDSIFSSESTAEIKSHALKSLDELSACARAALHNFESAILSTLCQTSSPIHRNLTLD